MAKGAYTIEHKGSDGDLITKEVYSDEDQAADFIGDIIDELEGDSGASITVTWEG